MFADVLRHAGGWPGARMVLFGADGELAAALDAVAGHPSRAAGRGPTGGVTAGAASARAGAPPSGSAPEPTAPRAARALVRQACIDWEIPIETENAAALVVSELATNAVVHAGTPLRVRVELSGEAVRSASATCVPTCRYACSPAMPVSPRAQTTFRSARSAGRVRPRPDLGSDRAARREDRMGATPAAGRRHSGKGGTAHAAAVSPRPLPRPDRSDEPPQQGGVARQPAWPPRER